MVSFNNTEIAFSHLDDKELTKARYLFSLFRLKLLSNVGPKVVTTMLKMKLPILSLVKKTMFSHFCGGESVEECKGLISSYGKMGVGAILDYSVEGADDEKTFDATTLEILRVIDEASDNPFIPFAVFKMTGICSSYLLARIQEKKSLFQHDLQKWERAKMRFERICSHAHEKRVRIFVDAEESWLQDPVDDLAEAMMEKYNKKSPIVFNTVQLYRVDRLNYMTQLYKLARSKNFIIGVKLVRGAYLEKERARAKTMGYTSPIHSNKAGVDRDFDLGVEFCLSRLEYFSICVATHNEYSVMKLIGSLKKKKLNLMTNEYGVLNFWG